MVKYLSPVPARAARGLLAQTYSQIETEFGALVEPFTLHSPIPTLLAGVWSACRESLLVGGVPRRTKEAIATAVSRLNGCPYCVDAHAIMLHASAEHGAARALRVGRLEAIEDQSIRDITAWAVATRAPGSAILLQPPFEAADAPEIVGTAVVFHYINRMVTILLGETPLPSAKKGLKGPLVRVAGWFFSRAYKKVKDPGASLALLPPAELPEDFLWAASSPNVAGAFARLAGVVEDSGRHIPEEAKARILTRVAAWDGADPGVSRIWVTEAASGLPRATEAAAELGLLAAVAPYQVDSGLVRSFQAYFPGDERLLSLLSWSSFQAARKIGSWLSTGGSL